MFHAEEAEFMLLMLFSTAWPRTSVQKAEMTTGENTVIKRFLTETAKLSSSAYETNLSTSTSEYGLCARLFI